MDITFVGEKYKFIFIYLDDMIVFSKYDEDHLKHLEHTFIKCRKFGLSINLKKVFVVKEGKSPVHIVSKEGVKIDHDRVDTINLVDIPKNKKCNKLLERSLLSGDSFLTLQKC